MKKSIIALIALAIGMTAISAAQISPGWTYGLELGVARGDNAGSRDNLAPLGRGFLQLEIFDFLYFRTGLGWTRLHGHDEYTAPTFLGDNRVIISPFHHKKYAPFIYGGVGASLKLADGDADVIPQFPMGLGMKVQLKRGMDLEVTAGYSLSNSDMLDGVPGDQEHGNSLIAGKGQDGFFSLTFGLAFSDPGPEPKKAKPQPMPEIEKELPPPPPPPVVEKPKVEEKPVVVEKPKVEEKPAPPDLKKLDSDGDGLSDWDEINVYKTDPRKADTDGDGLSDYDEVMKHKTDPLNKDTDKGGLTDGEEVAEGKDPLDPKDDVMDLTEGASFTLDGIMFETAKSTFMPESMPILEKAYAALAANPEVKVLIVGHTDNVGSASSNLTLSKNRADAVKNWLVEKGIDAARIRTDGKGLTQPRATNDTVEGRALNRRIEFIIE